MTNLAKLCIFLLFTSLTYGQSNTDDSTSTCNIGGWSYSASSSGSSSYSYSSSSSSSSICVQADYPEDCITIHPACQWCAQEDFSGKRCNLESQLVDQKCSDIQRIVSTTSLDQSNEANRFNIQAGSARIRVGDSVTIPFRVKEPAVYPVDFYYLMDVSYSMKDDLKTVHKLASELIATLQELTQGGQGSVRIGFGKFVDKVQSPMTQMTEYKLKHPYNKNTDAPFLFKNVVDLTSDIELFLDSINNETVSGNLDPPEGALDAMMQVIQCQDVIRWHGNSLRLMMVATESAYHYAADGVGFLAGISKANDGKCHTGADGIYRGAEDQDFPTVNQVVRALEEKSITPIFAIGSSYANLYEYVSKNVFRGSAWGILKGDSSNVVDLVRQAYMDITGKQELVTSNPNENVICPSYVAVTPTGVTRDLSVHNTLIEGLDSGSKVFYNMSLSANRDACAGNTACDIGDVVVKTRRYDDRLTVTTSVISAFGCASEVVMDSASCNGNGNFSCGICYCNSRWTGPACGILAGEAVGCLPSGGGLECSGRGRCLNDKCQCDPGYKHFKSKIYGDFCECDDCPKRAGLVCSGNGVARVDTCSCSCSCASEWSGDDCGCANTTDTCIGQNGLICSGFGVCQCGSCVCGESLGYGGPTCGDCLENCPSCAIFKDCIQCRIHGSGPLNQTCDKECADYTIYEKPKNSMKEEDIDPQTGTVLCAAIDDDDNCKFYYTYQAHPDGAKFYAENEKRCKSAYSLLIILWCILLFLLIGLILLCCWRCCVYVIDKEEAKNYRLRNIAMFSSPAMIPLLPAMGAGSVIEFIKAKYLVRRSAKLAVIPVRRTFMKGETCVLWRTYPGSSEDNDFEVMSKGEEGTILRKRQAIETLTVQGRNGESTIEIEPLEGRNEAAGYNGHSGAYAGKSGGTNGPEQLNSASTMRFEHVDETAPLIGNGLNWGTGEIKFKDNDEFCNIEIPLLNDFNGRETTFWVELYGQEKGVALGLKRTRIIVIKDEEAGIIGFPKPNYVFKENDGVAIIPVHRTVGMDGHVSVAWFTRDITGVSGKHYIGGRGVVNFADGEVTQHIEVPLIPDILYDDNEKAFNIMLEEPKGGASLDLSHCMVTVLGDEECSLVQFPKDAYPFMENCGIAEVAVMRTHSTKGVSTVDWYTEDDTAIAGKDYEESKGTITFANLETETHIRIPIIDNDVYDESGRAFRIVLADPSEGTKITHNVATISIIEDDEPGLFEFAKTSCVMRSKATLGRLTVIRSLGSDGRVTIPWCVHRMGANEIPYDVGNLSGMLYFENGEISKHLEIDLSHTESCDNMTFYIVLQDPTGGGKLGAKSQATVTVFAEQDLGTVSFAQQRFDVSATSGMVNLLVSRKGDVSSAAFVVCETADQTAISGTHYRGGIISVVFDGGETVKEVGIPVYNDPNHAGQLQFGVTLRSTPGGAKIGDPSEAVVAITCIPMTPVIHAGFAPPGPCTVEFIKSKYLFRRSAKYVVIPVHRSSSDGSCLIQWEATGPPSIIRPGSIIERSPDSSSSSSSSEDEGNEGEWGEGTIRFADGEISTSIELCLESRDMYVSQVSIQVSLLALDWEESGGLNDELRFGLKDTEVVILNDIDAGTLGFSKATFSFKESEGTVVIPVNRLGGMDGIVSARWRTVDDTAFESRDYEGGQGIITFANNQIGGKIEIKLLEGEVYDDQDERKFTIELDKFKGGAKSGIRRTTVFIIGDEDRSVVQFSKDSYPVIGNSLSVRIPVLRTGSFHNRAIVVWRTVNGSAIGGVDFRNAQNVIVFEPGETRDHIEVQLSGKASEAKNFNVELSTNVEEVDAYQQGRGKAILGPNKTATVSIINSQDPGQFEFGKSSFVFKTTTNDLGLVPVIRSGGTDGEVSIPWRIESLDKPSPFSGAEGFLKFRDGQVSSNIEIGLEGVPSDVFVLVLVPSDNDGPMLGSATRATITIIGEIDEPTIEMNSTTITFKNVELVQIKVLRKGNVTDATYVGWKTLDGTAIHNKNFIGGAGNLVFDPDETERNILIPVLASPNENPANFTVQLTDVRGTGKLNDQSQTEVTLEPVPKTIVEFLRKRYLFRQSQGSSLIPVRRSNANGILSLRWNTEPIKDENDMSQQVPSFRSRSRTSSTSSSDGEKGMTQKMNINNDDMEIDWGTGTVTFEDGDHEASIEIILCREMAHRESNFRIELTDSHDHVTLAVPTTMVTVIRDKDPGMLGFASPRYNFSCSESQLVIPVHRSSGADGTVAVPWFTRDATAVGGMHYIPADGNLVFGDGEVLKKISVPMPKRVGYFDEDEVAFKLCLGEPTGGAALSVYEAHVVLQNDIVPAQITFKKPEITCSQSSGSLRVPVQRTKDANGIVALSWQSRGLPGKPKSRYAGLAGTLVFDDGEEDKEIVMKLPVQVQPTNMDSFIIDLEQPTSGRATLGDYPQCTAKVDNDIIPGVFTLQKQHYTFKQSTGRDVIKVLRHNGTKGAVSLPWKVLPENEDSPPSPMHDLHGSVDFDDGQSEADVILRFPEDTDEDQENFVFVLLPPDGRAQLDEPYRANLVLNNDLKCEISFPKSVYDVRGDVDTFLVPVVRDGPKGRPAAVEYKTIDDTAVDCQHYIGGEGILSFESGENKKDILVPVMNDPNGGRVTFRVKLCSITGPAELGANEMTTVNIDNVTGAGYLEMMTSEMVVKQTSNVIQVIVVRKKGKKGAVDVPWFVERATPCATGQKPDDYEDLGGTLNFLDGESEKTLEIPLCDKPQDDDVTAIDVTLLTPTSGAGIGLGEVTSTRCVIENDLDGGDVEFEHERVEVFGTDGEAHIPVVRAGACNHACQVTWEANDDTALRGKHYRAGKGNLSFAPNETKKDIVIPIVNDASGDVMFFDVALTSVKGGTKLGAANKTQVLIDHVKEMMQEFEIMQEATPPNFHGEIGFVDSDADAKQSNGEIVLAVQRRTGNRGRVVVPWSIEDAPENSPYKDLHGQETFKDGEEESHIHIETPSLPQANEDEAFTVVLGEPTGGAMLCGDTRCDVVVYNDVVPGVISFGDNEVKVKQSEESLKIPINRSQRTEGKVRVPWKTICKDPESPFANFSGIETFEDGEDISHINLKIPQFPREEKVDRFDVMLSPPKSVESVLGDMASCLVAIENDIAPALIKFETTTQEALQSNGILKLKINREQQKEGRVIVPWKIVTDSPDSVYCDTSGETILESGDDHGHAEINLPQLPLTNDQEKITVILEPPVGAPATLGDDGLCAVNVIHDIGEGLIEMRSRDVSCPSENGEALVAVVRKLGQDFPAEITWETADDDALLGQHYEAEKGKLKFKPGEMERSIHIPLLNDPTGEDRHFFVRLCDVKGRDRVGDVKECRVKIENDPMPPTVVEDFDADLYGPQNVKASWLPPIEGAKPTGYKVTYWSRPGTVKTVELPQDIFEATLDDLQPSTSYQVNVRPFNSVGDGPASNTTVVETQPELRLSYQTPMQVKTSDKVATFYLKRNIKDFKDVVTWKIVKEIRKKKSIPSSISSQSSISSSSSSSDDEINQGEAPTVVSQGTLEFPPNTDHVTVNFPLKQDMRHSTQIYRMLVKREPRDDQNEEEIARERPLANVELNVINDTGYPGRVRKPFAASATPFECTTSWEAPSSGGPVEGYKVIARTDGEPDIVTTVGPDEKKTTLTGLKPSTNYDIMVQPFNNVGDAKLSSPTHITTQDELKVEFSERFYSFKTSEKVAVIPLKRHFTHGYATLAWNVRWCKRSDQSDSSSSDSEGENEARGREWASGSVAFADGADTTEVRIPLQQASPAPVPRKRSFFWLHVVDPNKKKRLAAMRCKLVDDKVYGRIGCLDPVVSIQGDVNARDVIMLPVIRHEGTDGHVTVEWSVNAGENANFLLSPKTQNGILTLCEGESEALVPIKLHPDWVETFESRDPIDVIVQLESPGRGAELSNQSTCILRLIPAERGVIEVKPVKTDLIWLEHADSVELDIIRKKGSFGRIYLQWELESSNGEDISDYFPKLIGDIHMANAETRYLLKVPTKSNDHDIPCDFPLTVKTTAITHGVKVEDGSKSVPFLIRAKKGELSVLPVSKIEWPVQNNNIEVKIVREKGETGPVYGHWNLSSDEKVEIDGYFKKTDGDFRMVHGQKQAKISIPTFSNRSQGPENDISVNFNLVPITDGVTLKTDSSAKLDILKPEPGGIINFVRPEFTFKTTGVECITIPLERVNGCGGDSTITYLIRDQTSESGVHYEETAIAGEVEFKDKMSSGHITVPLVHNAKYRKSVSFSVELIEITGDTEIGTKYKTEITLEPTYVEPPGVISFVNKNEDQIIACVNETDSLTIPVIRSSGIEGKISVICFTKEGGAIEGKHFVKYSDVIKFEDGETKKNIEIKLLPCKYKKELDFLLVLENEKGGCSIGKNNKLTVNLRPTYVEPPGTFVTINNKDIKSIVTSDLYQCPITRENGSGGKVSLQYKTRDGTAKNGVHFTDTTKRLEMEDGQIKTTLDVPLLPERYREELYFFIDLSDPEGGANIESNEMKVYLQPTDTEPCGNVTLPKSKDFAANATNTSTLNIPITRNNGVGGEVSVSVKTVNGSAKADEHYKSIDGKITLKDRQDKVEIPITLLPAIYREPLEFYVEIDKPEGGVEIGDCCKTKISLEPTDSEPVGRLVFDKLNDVNMVTCNANDDKFVNIPVKRVEGVGGVVSVNYSTEDGTAKAGIHYMKVDDDLHVKDRELRNEIKIPILPNMYRNDLDFTVELDQKDDTPSEIYKVILKATDTEPCGNVTLPKSKDFAANATNTSILNIPITRNNGVGGEVSVFIKTVNGSAKADKHYKPLDGKITLKDRQDIVVVPITLLPAIYREPLEFYVEIDKPEGGVKIGDCCKTKISLEPTDSEPVGRLVFDKPNNVNMVACNANDNKCVNIPVKRVGGVGGDVSVNYLTKDGTAKAGIHYTKVDDDLHVKDRKSKNEIKIPILPNMYRNDLDFTVELDQKDNTLSEIYKIILKATDTEPCGNVTLPKSKDFAANATNTSTLNIPITRNNGVGGEVSVSVKTVNRSAKADEHYKPLDGKITLKDRQDKVEIPITLLPAIYREPLEFYVEIDKPEGGVEIGDCCKTKISLEPTDSEPVGRLVFDKPNNVNMVTCNANENKCVNIPVKRVGGVGGDVSVNYLTKDGTAKAGIHYTKVDDNLHVKDRESKNEIKIPILPNMYRNDLDFTVELDQKDDTPSEIYKVILKATDTEPCGNVTLPKSKDFAANATNTSILNIPITRNNGVGGEVSVFIKTVNGSAKADKHYKPLDGKITLKDRQDIVEVPITLLPAIYREPLEFYVGIDKPEGGVGIGDCCKTKVSLEPTDSEPVGRLVFDKPNNVNMVTCNANDNKCVNIPVKRVGGVGGDVSVNYLTKDGTAKAGIHYTKVDDDLHVKDRKSKNEIKIPILPNMYRNDLDFTVELDQKDDTLSEIYKVILKATDTEPCGNVTLPKSKDFAANPTNTSILNIPITRNNGVGGEVSVFIKTVNGSAKADKHYKPLDGKITLKDRQDIVEVPITLLPAIYREPLEFYVGIDKPEGGVEIGDCCKTKISLEPTDSEPVGRLVFDKPNNVNMVTCNANDNKCVNIPVKRVGGVGGDVSVNYLTKDGTAKAGIHYTKVDDDLHVKDRKSKNEIKIPILPNMYRNDLDFTVELDQKDDTLSEIYKVILKATDTEPCGNVTLPKSKDFAANATNTSILNVPITRNNGVGGEVSVSVKTVNRSAKADEHYKPIDGKITLKDRQDKVEIPITLLPAIYREPLEFYVEIDKPEGGVEIGDCCKTKISLEPTDSEPVGRLVFDKPNNVNMVTCNANENKCVNIPVKRVGGVGGDVSVNYLTKDGTAKAGIHYTKVDDNLHVKDRESKNEIKIPILPNMYRNDLDFTVELDQKDDTPSEIYKVILKATDTEPCGNVTLPKSKDFAANATNTSILNIPITRNNGVGGEVSVFIKTVNGSAKADKHYKPLDGKITLKDRQDIVEVPITLLPAIYREPLEFYVGIDKPEGGVEIGDCCKTKVSLEPTDSEPVGRLVFDKPNNVNMVTCNANDNKCVNIPVKRVGGVGGDVSVNYLTKDGTAKAGIHYTKVDDDLHVKDRKSKNEIKIPILPNMYRNDLDFTVELDQKDDTLSEIYKVILKATDTEPCGNVTLPKSKDFAANPTNTSILNIPITRNNGVGGEVSVFIKTVNGSAKADKHYKPLDGKITLKDRQDIVEVPITLLPAIYREPLEFYVGIDKPEGGVEIGDCCKTKISLEPTDSEPVGRLVFDKPNNVNMVTCNANDNKCVNIPVKRVGGVGGDVSVNYLTKDGTAKAGIHYTKVDDDLHVKDRKSKNEIKIPILPNMYRNDLDFTVELDQKDDTLSEIYKVILKATDTEPCGNVTLPKSKDFAANATNTSILNVPITRNNGVGGEVSVSVKTVNRSAKADEHYKPIDGKITLKDRQDKVEIPITLLPAIYREPLEFYVEIDKPEGGVEIGDCCKTKISLEPTDSEPVGRLVFDKPNDVNTLSCNANDDKFVNIPVKRVEGVGGVVSVNYSTEDGTAKAGTHYTEVDDVLQLKDRESTGEIKIPILPNKYRNDLDFIVELIDTPPEVCKVTLKATDTEPCGKVTLPIDDVLEVNAKTCNSLGVPISRVNGKGGDCSVRLKTLDGSAKDGVHYKGIDKVVEIKDREGFVEVGIPLLPLLYRDQLYFTIELSDPQGGIELGDVTSSQVKFLPTDTEPNGYAELPEEAENIKVDANETKEVIIPVKRIGGVGGPLKISYSTTDGTAKSGIHYDPIDNTMTLKNRESLENIVIPLKQEKYREPKTFFVNLKQDGKDSQSTEIILQPTDTEPNGRLVFPSEEELSFNKTVDNMAIIPVHRVNGCGGELEVLYFTKNDSAKAGIHYEESSGKLKFKDREIKKTIKVPLLDLKYKQQLDFKVALDSKDNLQEVNVTLEPTSVNNLGSTTNKVDVSSNDQDSVVIPIVRQNGDLKNEINVPFSTSDKTAKADLHYVSTKGEATIPRGKTESSIKIPIKKSEHTKPLSFLVNFDNDLDDPTIVKVNLKPTKQSPPGTLCFTKTEYIHPGPDPDSTGKIIKIPVIREEGDGGKVSVEYFTRDNTAMSGTHYDETTGFLEFEDGETEKCIEVSIIPDISYQNIISFVLELGAATGGAEVYGVYETEVKLEPPLDKNDPGVLGFESDKVLISTSKLTKRKRKNVKIEIPVRRTYGCGGEVSVDYFTRDNTAVSGLHYLETEGELKFADSETTRNIEVNVLPGKHFNKQCSFTAELGGAYGDAEVGIYETEVILKPIASRGSSSSDSSSSSGTSSTSGSSSGSSTSSESRSGSSDDENVFVKESSTKYKSAKKTTPLEIREYVERKNIDAELQDGAGEIGFSSERFEFRRGVDQTARVPVARRDGNVGKVTIDWFTRENTAVIDKDFVECDGVASFAHGQSSTWISIPLLNRHAERQDGAFKERTFIVELGQPEGGATLGRYETLVALLEPDPTRLVAPKNAKIELQGPSSFVVSWEPQDATVLEYLVSYKRAGSQDEPNRHTMPSDQYYFQVDDLLPESAYAVVVSALGEGGQQVSSEVIGCKTPGKVPGPPNRLAFQVLSPTSLQCSWGEPPVTNGIITGYEVLYKPKDPDVDSQQLPVMVRIPDGHYRSLLVENLEENCTYLYSVRAQNKCGLGIPREATMKIEHMGSRPPSAIFLDEDNMKLLQEQIKIEQANRELAMAERARSISASSSDSNQQGSENRITTTTKYTQGQQPVQQTKSKSSMKTRVTRYIHKDGQREPEVETTEYDGKLSQNDLAKLAENAERIEVQVITYNSTSGVAGRSAAEAPQPPTEITLSNPYAQEYSNTDVQHDVTQNTDVYTDVEESKEGDTDVTTITKTYKTTTTERRLETTSGMRMMKKDDQS